jgi:hypothetical protein
VDRWTEPRLIVVHDVELPIPAYYFEPVVADIESAYLRAAADEQRSYNLHTAYQWEKTLPNLNPRKSRVTVGWALRKLAEGLVSGVIRRESGTWQWQTESTGREKLGGNLSTALYHLGEYHRKPNLMEILDKAVAARLAELGPDTVRERRAHLQEVIHGYLVGIELREGRGQTTTDDALDKPVFGTLQGLVGAGYRAAIDACGRSRSVREPRLLSMASGDPQRASSPLSGRRARPDGTD